MEYVYAAMLIHKAGKPVDEPSVTKVLEAASVKADPSRVKALVAALHGVDIDKVAKEAAVMPVAAAAAPAEKKQESKADEHKKAEDEKKSEEAAAAGLGALFG